MVEIIQIKSQNSILKFVETLKRY